MNVVTDAKARIRRALRAIEPVRNVEGRTHGPTQTAVQSDAHRQAT